MLKLYTFNTEYSKLGPFSNFTGHIFSEGLNKQYTVALNKIAAMFQCGNKDKRNWRNNITFQKGLNIFNKFS